MKNILTVSIILILVPLSAIFVLEIAHVLQVDLAELQGSGFNVKPKTLFIAYLFVTIQVFLVWVGHCKILNKKFSSLGFKTTSWFLPLLKGTLIGIGAKAAVYGIYISVSENFTMECVVPAEISVIHLATSYLYYLVFLLILNSFVEELVYRSFPLENLLNKNYPELLIVLFSALLFSMVHHILEPFSWTTFTTRFLFGTLAALFYLRKHNIWLPVGLHTGWNWISTSFSGNWRAGGIFDLNVIEPETSISVLSIVILVPIVLFYMVRHFKRRPERLGSILRINYKQ